MRNDLTLVADMGGTNSRLALAEAGQLRKESLRRFSNREFDSPEMLLRRYLGEIGLAGCARACIAMAGAVRGGIARITNLDWSLSEDRLRRICGAEKALILNDLQAQAHALGRLPESALRCLRPGAQGAAEGGSARGKGVKLVLGMGTGFNIATLHDCAGGQISPASETGHASLPCPTPEDFDFAAHLRARHGAAEIEDALSGRGLKRLHAWQAGIAEETAPEGPEILRAALAGQEPAAARALEQFLRLLGQVIGDLALSHLPEGGVYLTGSVSRAMAPHLGRAAFTQALLGKGRFADMRGAFPLWLIESDWAALTGCAARMAETP